MEAGTLRVLLFKNASKNRRVPEATSCRWDSKSELESRTQISHHYALPGTWAKTALATKTALENSTRY